MDNSHNNAIVNGLIDKGISPKMADAMVKANPNIGKQLIGSGFTQFKAPQKREKMPMDNNNTTLAQQGKKPVKGMELSGGEDVTAITDMRDKLSDNMSGAAGALNPDFQRALGIAQQGVSGFAGGGVIGANMNAKFNPQTPEQYQAQSLSNIGNQAITSAIDPSELQRLIKEATSGNPAVSNAATQRLKILLPQIGGNASGVTGSIPLTQATSQAQAQGSNAGANLGQAQTIQPLTTATAKANLAAAPTNVQSNLITQQGAGRGEIAKGHGKIQQISDILNPVDITGQKKPYVGNVWGQ